MKKWKIVALSVGIPLTVILTVITALGVLGWYVARSMTQAVQVDHDLTTYPDNLKQWQSTGLVGHFPPAIPQHATSVTFCESPGFLQADPYIQLRLVLPAAEVEQLQNDLSSKAMNVFTGGGARRDHLQEEGGLPTTFYRTATSTQQPGYRAFPPDFSFYVLSAVDTSGTGTWHGGRNCGVAINPTTNEVVYWAEMW